MRFASFFSGGFTTMAVMNTPEKKLQKRTSVHPIHCTNYCPECQILSHILMWNINFHFQKAAFSIEGFSVGSGLDSTRSYKE